MRTDNELLCRQQTNVLRGFAAVNIALFHVFIAWDCHRIVNLPGSVFVALFLILSGYGLNESYKRNGLDQYWRRRFSRVILPWWLFLAAIYVVRGFPGWTVAVKELFFIESEFWYMPYIMWCYVAYYVACRFFSQQLVCVLMVIGFVSLNTLHQMAAEQSLSFVAGVWLSQHISELRAIPLRKILFYIACSAGIGLFFLLLKEIPAIHELKFTLAYNYILLFIKLPLAIPFLFLPMVWPCVSHSRVLSLAGISSLELYLVHMPMVNFTAHSWPRLGLFILLTVFLTYIYHQVNKSIARVL